MPSYLPVYHTFKKIASDFFIIFNRNPTFLMLMLYGLVYPSRPSLDQQHHPSERKSSYAVQPL
jgi:hypothetical protein